MKLYTGHPLTVETGHGLLATLRDGFLCSKNNKKSLMHSRSINFFLCRASLKSTTIAQECNFSAAACGTPVRWSVPLGQQHTTNLVGSMVTTSRIRKQQENNGWVFEFGVQDQYVNPKDCHVQPPCDGNVQNWWVWQRSELCVGGAASCQAMAYKAFRSEKAVRAVHLGQMPRCMHMQRLLRCRIPIAG